MGRTKHARNNNRHVKGHEFSTNDDDTKYQSKEDREVPIEPLSSMKVTQKSIEVPGTNEDQSQTNKYSDRNAIEEAESFLCRAIEARNKMWSHNSIREALASWEYISNFEHKVATNDRDTRMITMHRTVLNLANNTAILAMAMFLTDCDNKVPFPISMDISRQRIISIAIDSFTDRNVPTDSQNTNDTRSSSVLGEPERKISAIADIGSSEERNQTLF